MRFKFNKYCPIFFVRKISAAATLLFCLNVAVNIT
uniref:Uncharacterized protein n=1 Tax=Rhizophora mucronata TaxID=61149 RepID=A0A2P2Q6R9_RHIMU